MVDVTITPGTWDVTMMMMMLPWAFVELVMTFAVWEGGGSLVAETGDS